VMTDTGLGPWIRWVEPVSATTPRGFEASADRSRWRRDRSVETQPPTLDVVWVGSLVQLTGRCDAGNTSEAFKLAPQMPPSELIYDPLRVTCCIGALCHQHSQDISTARRVVQAVDRQHRRRRRSCRIRHGRIPYPKIVPNLIFGAPCPGGAPSVESWASLIDRSRCRGL
jgi:hypothetical protein